jgi:FkbM family methyltransferase
MSSSSTAGTRASMDENALVCRALTGLIERGVMVDVGACHGSVCAPMLRAGWRVEAFEPDRSKWGALEELEAQGLRLHRVAADEEDREGAAFYTSAESIGIASLLAFRETHVAAGVVPVRTLRTALGPLGLGRVDYLKVDAEGYDLRVLRGYPWASLRPRAVVCEFEDRKTRGLGYTMPDMAGYLEGLGYEVWVSEWKPIERYGVSHAWRSIRRWPCQLEDAQGWGNLVAVEPGVVAQRFAAVVREAARPGRTAAELAGDAVVGALLPAGRVRGAVERARAMGADRVALLGAGAHTRAALEVDAGLAGEIVCVLDENPERWGQVVGGVRVVPAMSASELSVGAVVASSDAHHGALLAAAERVGGACGARAVPVYRVGAAGEGDAVVAPVMEDDGTARRVVVAAAAEMVRLRGAAWHRGGTVHVVVGRGVSGRARAELERSPGVRVLACEDGAGVRAAVSGCGVVLAAGVPDLGARLASTPGVRVVEVLVGDGAVERAA